MEAIWIVPIALVLLLVAGYFATNRLMRGRLESRYGGDIDAAMADHENPVPSAHLIPDDETPLGDTKEAHDELSPHDLPKGHPGRAEAVGRAARREGVTQGNR